MLLKILLAFGVQDESHKNQVVNVACPTRAARSRHRPVCTIAAFGQVCKDTVRSMPILSGSTKAQAYQMQHPRAGGLGRREIELAVKYPALKEKANWAEPFSARAELWLGLHLFCCSHAVVLVER